MTIKKIKIPETQKRSMIIDSAVINEQDSRLMEFSFVSDEPIDMYYGKEILSLKDGAVDLTRLNSRAPLLFNHDSDKYIGVVEKAWIDPQTKKGMVQVRFSDNDFAEKIYQDVKNKILSNVSVGYTVRNLVLIEENSDGPSVYEATNWEPYEVSIVTIPADIGVGVGRSANNEREMEVEISCGEIIDQTIQPTKEVFEASTPSQGVEVMEAVELERERSTKIASMGAKYELQNEARDFIQSGKKVEEFQDFVLEKLNARQVPVHKPTELELSEKEKKSYSLVRALHAHLSGKWNDAGFERECSVEIEKRTGKSTQGFFFPTNIKMNGERAAYNVGTGSQGGNLVATDYRSDAFIDLLRNNMLIMQMGAKILSGLVGNIAIPKQLSSAAAYWVTEGTDVTESEGTFGLVSMAPKTVGARSQMTRQMMQQSTPDIEMLVRSDLAKVLALAIDAAAINGSGSAGQPKGILNQTGIGAYNGSTGMGANGGSLTNIDPLIDIETLVAIANADFGSLGYLANAKTVGALKKLKSTTNEYLWNGYEAAVGGGVPGEINGYRVGRTNQVPSTLAKGTSGNVCSALLFGNFNDLIIGQWGPGIEILANPFGAGFNNGAVDIRALASVDVALRNSSSFAAITDII